MNLRISIVSIYENKKLCGIFNITFRCRRKKQENLQKKKAGTLPRLLPQTHDYKVIIIFYSNP
jgi:hypothetical protein